MNMPSRTSSLRLVRGGLLVLATALVLAGCTPPAPTTGTLAIAVAGLPAGVDADITVVGTGPGVPVTGSTSLTLAPGSYEVVVAPVGDLGYWSDDSTTAQVVVGATTDVSVTYVATTVASFIDDVVGTDVVVPALDATAATHTTLADTDELIDALDGLDHHVFFVLFQNNGPESDVVDALAAAVAAGARVVFTTFEASDAWEHVDVLSVQSTAPESLTFEAPLDDGVPATVAVTNPGWGVYAVDLEPAAGAVTACETDLGDVCVVIGNDGRTIALGFLSDIFDDTDQGEAVVTNLLEYLLR